MNPAAPAARPPGALTNEGGSKMYQNLSRLPW